MPFFLPLLLAVLILTFIPVCIRILHGEKNEIQIEIQPIIFTFKSKEKSNGKKSKKEGRPKEIISLVRLALPHSRITVSKLDISVFSDEVFPLYTNSAFIGAALYPLLSYVGMKSKKLTVKNDALECTPGDNDSKKTSFKIDITFELRLYSVIFVLTKYFLLKQRRTLRARRNEGSD